MLLTNMGCEPIENGGCVLNSLHFLSEQIARLTDNQSNVDTNKHRPTRHIM